MITDVCRRIQALRRFEQDFNGLQCQTDAERGFVEFVGGRIGRARFGAWCRRLIGCRSAAGRGIARERIQGILPGQTKMFRRPIRGAELERTCSKPRMVEQRIGITRLRCPAQSAEIEKTE